MHQEELIHQDENTSCHGYLAYDDKFSQKRPGILIVHDAWGCGEFVRVKARKLAELGYVAYAVDMYGNGKTAHNFDEAIQLVTPILNDRALIKRRLLSAYEKLKQVSQVDTQKLGAMGFCFGGLSVLDLARYGVDLIGVVSFHGMLTPPPGHVPQLINAKILALHGYADPRVPPTQVQAFADEMTVSKADWQIHMYGHVMHAFANPIANDPAGGRLYDATADRRSWQAMQNFFAEIFT